MGIKFETHEVPLSAQELEAAEPGDYQQDFTVLTPAFGEGE